MYRCIHACGSGHFLISPKTVKKDELCELCGLEMIDRCPTCGTMVKEWECTVLFELGDPDDILKPYCPNCGKPYPWTISAIEMAADVLEEETELSDAEQERLVAVMPDILAETPNTPAAVELFGSAILSGDKCTAHALRDIVRECGCKAAKRRLGL